MSTIPKIIIYYIIQQLAHEGWRVLKKNNNNNEINANQLPRCCAPTSALSYSNACDLYDLTDNNRSCCYQGNLKVWGKFCIANSQTNLAFLTRRNIRVIEYRHWASKGPRLFALLTDLQQCVQEGDSLSVFWYTNHHVYSLPSIGL